MLLFFREDSSVCLRFFKRLVERRDFFGSLKLLFFLLSLEDFLFIVVVSDLIRLWLRSVSSVVDFYFVGGVYNYDDVVDKISFLYWWCVKFYVEFFNI